MVTTGAHRFIPRFVAADEVDPNAYSGCFPACVLMELIYWYIELKPTTWNAPNSLMSPDWLDVVKSSMKHRTIGGVEFKEERENVVAPILESVDAQADLAFDVVFPASVLEAARTLARSGVPVTLYFDERKYETGRESQGFYHSAVYLEEHNRNIRVADPVRHGVRGYMEYPAELFAEVLIPRITYLRPRGIIKVESVVAPRRTLRDFGVKL